MVASVSRIASLEPALQGCQDAITSVFDDAATIVNNLSPAPAIAMLPPMRYIWGQAGYSLPVDFPAVVLGGSNLRRVGAPNAIIGGDWRGGVELHCWLQNDDPTTLARELQRYAAAVWLCVLSGDMANALGGARVVAETVAVDRYPEPGASVAQAGIVVSFDVGLRA